MAKNQEKLNFKTKTLRQGIICAVIFLLIFGISRLNTDTAKVISNRIKAFVTYTVDYRKTGEEIKEKVINLWKGITNDEDTKTS